MNSLSMVRVVACGLLVLPFNCHAEWTGKGEAGAALATGNTVTESGNVKLDFATEDADWKHTFGLSGIYASGNNTLGVKETTAQHWEGHEQSDYKVTPATFWFGALRYEQDRFGGFVYQTALTTGVGHKFIDTTDTTFTAQVGTGYKITEARLVPGNNNGTRKNGVVVTAGAELKQVLTSTTSLFDKLQVEATSSNKFVQNELSLQVKVNTKLALAVGYVVRYNTDPTPGFKKEDTLTTVNLVFEFK